MPRARRAAAVIGGGVVLATAAWPVGLTLVDATRGSRDERAGARSWIYENVPSGAVVAIDSYAPWLDPDRYELRPHPVVITQVERLLDEGEAAAIVVSSTGSGRYPETQEVIEELGALACVKRMTFDATGPASRNRIDVFLVNCASSEGRTN